MEKWKTELVPADEANIARAAALLHPCAARRLTAALGARRTGAAALLHSAGYVG